MNKIRLWDVATVQLSSIDKKYKDWEKEVNLCNFIDVYHNWAITKDNEKNFMKASASDKNIHDFSIKKWQVAITKDSETKDDIWISCYMSDSLENSVLWYHCALITPDDKYLSWKYLNVVFHSSYAKKYFEYNATGSGQRYSLMKDIIEDFPVPNIDIERQRKVWNFFSNIDKKLKINDKIVSELEAIWRELYEYRFLQFDFPDENGNPYKSSGWKMAWNKVLKWEIPEWWDVVSIWEIADLYQPQTLSWNELLENWKYPVYGANWVVWKYNTFNHEENEIAICCRWASCWNFLMTLPNAWINWNAMVVTPKSERITKELLYFWFSNERIAPFITWSAQPQITRTSLENYKVIIPNKNILYKFDWIATKLRKKLQNIQYQNIQLSNVRDFLIPMLINEQVTVK